MIAKIQRTIQNSWTSAKQTDDIRTTKTNDKKTFRYKGNKPSHKINVWGYTEILPHQLPRLCREHLTNQGKSPNFKYDFDRKTPVPAWDHRICLKV